MILLKMKYIYITLLMLLLQIFAPYGSVAQNAPVTTATTIGDVTPGTVTIPVTVTGFTFIGAISLTLEFDGSVLQFIQGIKNPLLPGSFVVTDNDQGNGFRRLTMGWYGPGTTLPDGSSIVDLVFTYTEGITLLEWIDLGGSCEYADGNYIPLNDIPTSDFYINGHVCGIMGTPGPVTGDTAVCPGQSGVIYSIQPVANAPGYSWSVPPGADIISGQGTNSITVDYSNNATSGFVEVFLSNPCGSGAVAQLPVQVNELPVADAGDDFTMNYGTSTTLQAAPGGTGSYYYHWSPEELLIDPNVQNPQTVIMTSSVVFTLVVTNLETLCENGDQVSVTVTGGPLSVNPVAIPGNICSGGSSQLFANAGGGSGDYTYLWTSIPAGNPPWSSTLANPVVSPDSSILYIISLDDGFSTVNGTAQLTVHALPTATISGCDTLCGTGSTTTLPIDLTGTPPWNFIYTFDNTSVNVNNQYTTPYLVTALDPATYTVTYVEDAHCTGVPYGNALVELFPVPPTPEITMNGLELISSACCGNQWYFDGEAIPGATNQNHTATQSGAHFVIVTLNGCSSDHSDTVDVTVGINEPVNRTLHFNMTPNPFNYSATFNYNLPVEGHVILEIASGVGQRLLILVNECQATGSYKIFIDADKLKPGFYTATLRVKTKSDQLIRTIRIMKA